METKFSRSVRLISIKYKNKYTNYYFKRRLPSFFVNHVLKSMRNSSVRAKVKNMRTLHIQLLFQSATESYSIHPGANNDTLTILAQFN